VGYARWIRRLAVVALLALAVPDTTAAARGGDRATAAPAGALGTSVGALEDALRPASLDHATSRQPALTPTLLVRIPRDMALTARPGAGRVVGTMPASSRFYDVPIVAWVLETTADGRFGRVPIPYTGREATGWLRLRGLEALNTRIAVIADLSDHEIEVRRGPRVLFRAPAATGAPVSPTPPGSYFVTDRVAFQGGGSLGTFAFGISGIQTHLPPGWSGGDQLAIHGTNAPGTIGTSASAGCLRVSERVLDRLRPLLRLGTPVVIQR
jgi:hypothetical protein